MQHLSPERLAALADDPPTPGEAEHIERCGECARERAAHRELLVMARAERDAIAAPLTDWGTIAGALRQASPLAGAGDAGDASHAGAAPGGLALVGGRRAQRAGRSWRWAAQAAAAVVLVAGGVVAGRRSVQPAPSAPLGSAVASAVDGAPATATPVSNPSAGAPAQSNDQLVPDYQSVAEARAALTRYEIAYQNAAAYLAEHDSSTRLNDSEAYRTRLAALDRVGRAMREAMREAPYDPVINGYYLTTVGQREATMRQLNTALPSGVRLTSF